MLRAKHASKLCDLMATPSIKLAGTHSRYTRVEKGTVKVKCLTQEDNIVHYPKVYV